MTKRTFDVIFITVTAILLMVLPEYIFSKICGSFALVPILTAYLLGQYAERKFKK